MRYLTLLRIFMANSIQLELEYRANLLIDFVSSLLGFASGLVVIYAMFNHATAIGGWSLAEAVALFGVFMIFEAFIEVFLYPNLGKLPDYVRTGNMDFMLLKPLSSQFLVSFRYFNIWRAPDALVGLALLGYGMLQTGGLAPVRIAIAVVMLVAGAIITYAIWCMLTTTAFWWVRVSNVMELFNAFFVAGRFPVTAFPLWVRVVLTFIVPIAFITTVPASAAVGRLDWPMALASLAIAGGFLLLSHLFWRRAVASYTSASS
jgi:ABC-2 type transport system permease protein